MSKLDYYSLHLLPEEEKALIRYSRMDSIPEDSPYFESFRRMGFIAQKGGTRDAFGVVRGGCYVASDECRRYVHWFKTLKRDKCLENLRYVITTLIAFSALLVSLFSLISSSR